MTLKYWSMTSCVCAQLADNLNLQVEKLSFPPSKGQRPKTVKFAVCCIIQLKVQYWCRQQLFDLMNMEQSLSQTLTVKLVPTFICGVAQNKYVPKPCTIDANNFVFRPYSFPMHLSGLTKYGIVVFCWSIASMIMLQTNKATKSFALLASTFVL